MKRKERELLAVMILILATVGTVLGAFAIERYRRHRVYTIELIARAPEHGNWYPQTIRAPYGKEVRILIRNIETVTHGFTVPDLQIAAGEIKAGEVKAVQFIADRKGTFPFHCTVWCSEQHMEMRGELIVE